MFRTFTARSYEIFLPTIIRKHTISNMSFKSQPTFCSRNERIFRNTDTHLRNRTALGIAFQLQDDWLDTYGDPAIFGKEIGGDIVNRKKTWLLITALNESDGDLADILREDLSDHELVAQVRRVYDRLNLRERCSALAEEYSQKAIKALESVEMDADARNFFTELAKQASTRAH